MLKWCYFLLIGKESIRLMLGPFEIEVMSNLEKTIFLKEQFDLVVCMRRWFDWTFSFFFEYKSLNLYYYNNSTENLLILSIFFLLRLNQESPRVSELVQFHLLYFLGHFILLTYRINQNLQQVHLYPHNLIDLETSLFTDRK